MYYLEAGALALVGFFIGGPEGAAIGWTVGAWLFGPKADTGNQIFDPGAQEMPRINQALRGATMPILFGTNRVASNIVWTKNFATIRSESTTGSGGKAGGSGMGKAPSGPTNVSYTYKWDMLFHIGMATVPMTLYGGWANTNKIDVNTILAISTGAGNVAITPTTQTPDDIGLSFTDSYFGQAQATGSTIQSAWPYFGTQEGSAVRWPYTTYVGFHQFVLGSSPSVPQLSWEVGPGQAIYTYANTQIWADSYANVVAGTPAAFTSLPSGDLVIKGLDGNSYVPVYDGTSDLTFERIESRLHLTLPAATFATDAVAQLVAGATGWFAAKVHIAIPCGTGSDKVWVVSGATDSGAGKDYIVGVLYSINASGALVAVGGCRFRISSSASVPLSRPHIKGVGRFGQGAVSDNVMFAMENDSGDALGYVAKLPPPDLSGTLIDDTAGAWNTNWSVQLTALGASFMVPSTSKRSGVGTFGSWCAFLPVAVVGVGVTWSTKLIIVRPHWETTNPGVVNAYNTTQAALYPNGYIVEYNFSDAHTITSGPTVNNTLFTDASGVAITYPFAEDILQIDGVTADTSQTGYVAPALFQVDPTQVTYAWVMMMPKIFLANATNQPAGAAYSTVRAFLWNPFVSKASDYGKKSGVHYNVTSATKQANAYYPVVNQTTHALYLVGEFASPSNSADFTVGQFGGFTIGGQQDVTPAYILYQILTHLALGAGVPVSSIDNASYLAAVAYCEANNIKVSVQYNREDNLLSIMEELLALFNCFLIVSGGTIRFGLQDFSVASVRTLDNSHFVVDQPGTPPVQTVKGARQDSYNRVKVNYFDRNLAYRQNMTEVADEVDVDITGPRTKEFQPKFVMLEGLANQIGLRALWTNLYARDTYQFKIGPKDQDLEPGDPITLVDSFDNTLSGGQRVRIGRIKQTKAAVWEVTAVKELEYTQNASLAAFAVTSPTAKGDTVGGVGPPLAFRAYEMPQEFQGSAQQVMFGYNPSQMAAGARVYISPDGVTYGRAADIQPYVINGIFAAALPTRPIGFMERNVTVYLSPASGFVSSSPTYAQTYNLDDVTEAGREVGQGVIIVGSEALAMEGLTLTGQNTYKISKLYRGWGGTPIQAIASGDYWHRHGGGVMAIDITPDKIGTNFYYKVTPYNFLGTEYPITSIDAKTWTVKDWPVTPQAIADLNTFIGSATVSQSISLPSNGFRQVVAGGCDVTVLWSRASRTTGFGVGGFGKNPGGYGGFTADTSSPNYRVEVLSGNTMVRSTTVNTEGFTYTLAQNSADFNAWKGDYQIRITPYNGYGLTPVAAITTLHMF